ncbi:MAG: DDE-type integrase/transposase/recombinase [Lewinellaceae bacterium]|nr:DDE-type integrase/transposase/recombinase [Lewinellaceae bacterium]
MNALYLLCGISKQGHWEAVRRAVAQRAKEPCYVGLMLQIREMHPGMGLRAMYEQFQPEGIGRDAFICLGLREGFRLRVLSNPQRTTWSVKSNRYTNLLEGKRFTNINQLWTSDIFYFGLQGRHYYVVLIMDVYSRRIIGYSVADNLRAENNLLALNMALTLRGVKNYEDKLIHHSDRGVQYISNNYTELLTAYGIQISMCIDVLENAHMERANGTIKNAYLNRWNIKNLKELTDKVPFAVENYNNRNHQAIGMTPIEFESYVKELDPAARPELEIFTMKQNIDNPFQLSLNLDL